MRGHIIRRFLSDHPYDGASSSILSSNCSSVFYEKMINCRKNIKALEAVRNLYLRPDQVLESGKIVGYGLVVFIERSAAEKMRRDW